MGTSDHDPFRPPRHVHKAIRNPLPAGTVGLAKWSERFLQMNRLPSEREDAGLQSVFKSVFPISDFRENSSARVHRVFDRQLGVQVRQAAGASRLRRRGFEIDVDRGVPRASSSSWSSATWR